MAVTQQLMRIKASEISKCSISENKLEELISFKLGSLEDYLDLDWAPKGLEQYCKLSKQSQKSKNDLYIILNGIQCINEQCHDSVNGYSVYSNITILPPKETKMAFEGLKSIDLQSLENAMLNEEIKGTSAIDLDCKPNEYYLPKIRELIKFVSGATDNDMGIVQWWD